MNTSIDRRRHSGRAAVTFDVPDDGGGARGRGPGRPRRVEPPGRHVGVVLGRNVRVWPTGEEQRRRFGRRVRLVLGHRVPFFAAPSGNKNGN